MASYDVLTMGRVGVDLYPLQVGVGLAEVETFGRYLGGSATNVAVAAVRHGRRTAVITRTGADPFGRYVHAALRGFGVDDRYVTDVAGLPTPVTFCEVFPPDDFPLYFYRLPTAPDLQIRAEELDLDAVRDAGVFWATVTGLSAEPSRAAHLAAWHARSARQRQRPDGDRHADGARGRRSTGDPRPITVLDLDWRPVFWSSTEEAGPIVRTALGQVTVAVGNLAECEMAVGTRDPRAAADALLDLGVGLAVVKQGPRGVLGRTRDEVVELPPVDVYVLNGLGAGDGFGGALCHGLLAGWPLERTLRFANAAGAIVASRLECSSAMPTTAEVEALLGTVSVR
jgi:5-dehydro-2-deoxygluconokinase